MGDFTFRYDPPFPTTSPYVPMPITQPIVKPQTGLTPGWDFAKLKEYRDLLKEIKELEDKVGCPCEPNKANYIKMIEDKLEELKK